MWGNYDRDSALVHVDVGSFKALPQIAFDHALLERIANLEVTLTDLRQQSVAPQVLNAYQWLVSAAGDSFAMSRIAVLLDRMQVASPDPNTANNNVAAHLYRALRFYYTETPRALEEINTAKELDPTNPLILGLRSLTYARLGQFDAALQDAQNNTRLAPAKWAGAPMMQGIANFLAGNCDQAIPFFSATMRVRSNDWFPAFFRGFCYQLKRNYPAARADLENAVRLGPEASYPYLSLIILDLREGRLDDAKQSLAVVQQRFTDPDLATRQMRAFFAAKGEQNLFSLITSSAGNLALGVFQSVERYTASGLTLLAQAENANASPESVAQVRGMIADLNVQRGLAQCNQQKFADAETSYSDAIAADPSFTLLYLLRAEVRLRQGNQPGAAEDMVAAQQNAPSPDFTAVLKAAQAGQLSCATMLIP